MNIAHQILKLDYSLANKLAYHRSKVIPGTVFFFTYKISFLFLAVYSVVLSLLPLNHWPIEVLVGMLVVGVLVVMYGGQKPVEKIIREYKLEQEYKQTTKPVRRLRNVLALLLLILVFAGGFYMAVTFMGDYINK
jgi:hypothetical protein